MIADEVLQGLSEFSQVFFAVADGETIKPCFLPFEALQTPLLQCHELREQLMTRQSTQEAPVIYRDPLGMYFGCIGGRQGRWFLLYGPIALQEIREPFISRFHSRYGIPKERFSPVGILRYTQILSLAGLLYQLIQGRSIPREQLIRENGLGEIFQRSFDREILGEELAADRRRQEETETHHSSSEEREILKAVSEGRGRDAIALSMKMDQNIGRLSADSFMHALKGAVASITLCTRAAMEGGILPDRAYGISDFYIRKLDECRDVHMITECRNHAIWDLAEAVRAHMEKPHTAYVEKCRDYIHRNYREEITLQKAADYLGISAAYLSRLFTRWEGVSFRQYLSEYRLSKAEQLLRYGEEDIISISEQLRFSSSGYFCRVFREKYGMTPGQYRRKYGSGDVGQKKS